MENKLKHEKYILYCGFLFLLIGFVLFALRAKGALHILFFGDETEKFVAAQMINHGMHLYRDIFAHHGPLPYIISHIYTNLVSPSDFSYIRILIVLLTLVSSLAIYLSPIFKNNSARMWTIGAYFFMLSSIWTLQSIHMVLYYQIGGFLFTLPALQLFVPLFLGSKPNKFGLFISGMAVTLICFSAYAFGPSVVLLIVAALILVLFSENESKYDVKLIIFYFSSGLLFSFTLILIWMFLFSDIVGFLVYHFYFNQKIYSEFIGFSSYNILYIFSFNFTKVSIIHTFTFFTFFIWVYLFTRFSFEKYSWKVVSIKLLALVFVIAAVLYLNPRGSVGFQDSAFVIVNFSFFVFAIGFIIQRSIERESFVSTIKKISIILCAVLLFEGIGMYAVSSPHGISRKNLKNNISFMRPDHEGLFEFIRSVTKKDGYVLSLIFSPEFYIKADRLPASGNYYYLPWQASYNKKPILGYKISICDDINNNRPSVIFFDNGKIWGQYSIEQYESCVPSIIENLYTALPGAESMYLRNDIFYKLGLSLSDSSIKMRPSKQLETTGSVPVFMTLGNKNKNSGIKRIGIMFGTYARKNIGNAELRLVGQDGIRFSQRFSLSDLQDNKYKYFDIDSKIYSSGAIFPISGYGVSTWESDGDKTGVNTCIIYQYITGEQSFTPGCPLF